MKFVITAVRKDGSEYRVGDEIEVDVLGILLSEASLRFDVMIDALVRERA